MKSRPDAPVCWAAASAAGKTTVDGWKTDSLWTSSCSTTCEDAPFTSAAKRVEDRRREISISLRPPSGPRPLWGDPRTGGRLETRPVGGLRRWSSWSSSVLLRGGVDRLRGVSLLVDHDRTLERDHDRAVRLVPGRPHGHDPDVRARPGRALFQDL